MSVLGVVGTLASLFWNFLRDSSLSWWGFVKSFVEGWQHHDRVVEELQAQLDTADSYDEWLGVAKELDRVQGRDEWKRVPEMEGFDALAIENRTRVLRGLAADGNITKMLRFLRAGLNRNLGGLGSPMLYQHCLVGTKHVVQEYNDEVVRQLEGIRDHAELSAVRKMEFFDETRHSYGRTALLLSGGASLAIFHLGVVKTLCEHNLMPRVLSGSSGGSIIAAMVATVPEHERADLFVPSNFQFIAFEDVEAGSLGRRLRRLFRRGGVMKKTLLERTLKERLGNMTFAEAFERSGGCVLNITVSPTQQHHQPLLLNYLSAPTVCIWSAVLASCALPGLFAAQELIAKDANTGVLAPWHPIGGVKWKDGSLSHDLPMRKLAELFNVNHFVVSQVNPHVMAFQDLLEQEDAVQRRQTVWNSLWYLLTSEVRHRLIQLSHLGLLPALVDHLTPLVAQRYRGDVTVLPARVSDLRILLKNPSLEDIARGMQQGERAMWPKLHMVADHMAVEVALARGVERGKESLMVPGLFARSPLHSRALARTRGTAR